MTAKLSKAEGMLSLEVEHVDRTMTIAELAQRVEWEGGALDAVEYGIRADLLADPELRELWKELEIGYKSLWPLVSKIESRLRKAA